VAGLRWRMRCGERSYWKNRSQGRIGSPLPPISFFEPKKSFVNQPRMDWFADLSVQIFLAYTSREVVKDLLRITRKRRVTAGGENY